jgi:hypothetical protein
MRVAKPSLPPELVRSPGVLMLGVWRAWASNDVDRAYKLAQELHRQHGTYHKVLT